MLYFPLIAYDLYCRWDKRYYKEQEGIMRTKIIRVIAIAILLVLVLTATALADGITRAGSRSCPRCGDTQGTCVWVGNFSCHQTTCLTCKTVYLQPHTSNGTGFCPKCDGLWGGR